MIRVGSILQSSWDWRAAGNFMFGGTGSGLILMMAAASYPESPPLSVGLAALGFVGLGLLLVWLELGRPWRFIHVFFHPQTSWMTRESIIGTVLFPTVLVGVLFSVPAAVALAGLVGLAFLYCQARILHAAKGIPAWREAAIVPLIIATGLTEGAGVLILTLSILDRAPGWTLFVFIALLASRGYAWVNYRNKLTLGGAPAKSLSIMTDINAKTLWGGNILPLAMMLIALLLPNMTTGLAGIAAFAAIASGWYMKFVIVTRAAQVQGYGIGKLKRGRPTLTPPVRRKPDTFAF